MTIVESARPITGGVDTHLDEHVAAVVDNNGGVLDVQSFRADRRGFRSLHEWLSAWRAPARMARG
jgi:transposase